MAGIDKTYVRTWEQYLEVKEFVSKFGLVEDDFGNKFYPSEFLAGYTEEEFREIKEHQEQSYLKYYSDPKNVERDKKWFERIGGHDWKPDVKNAISIVIWNTPTYFDIWLIRNCEIDFIVQRLKEQYGEYDAIKSRTSEFDTFKPERGIHYKIYDITSNVKITDEKLWWWIQSEVSGFEYNEEENKWYDYRECREFDSNTAHLYGKLSKRKLSRMIKHWNLPVGTVLRFQALYNSYSVKEFYIKVIG